MNIHKKLKRKFNAVFRQQSGQALLEYILLTFVVVSLTVGFILEISRGTTRFAENYFGSYLECLLQTGELPRLGSDTAPETECDDLYQPFTIADGRPEVNSQTNNTSSDSGNNSDDSKNPDNNSEDDNRSSSKGGDNSESDVASGSSGSGADGPSSEFGASGKGRQSRVPTASSSEGKDDSGKKNTLNGTNNFAQSELDDFSSSGRNQYVPIISGAYGEAEEEAKADVVSAGSIEEAGARSGSKSIPIAVKKDRTVQSEKDEELSFGDYLRYLVIGVIILAIVIVVGGQLFQFQKSS